jgi:threonyl-tRNA synthetase
MSNQNDQQYLDNLRHSTAHLLAAAVMELWPDTKRTIGPAIENGFYFDFEFSQPISDADFPKIEAKMHEIIKSWNGFERHELPAEKAKQEYPDNQYKHELIDEFAGEGQTLTFYKSGEYWDLCKGGHVEQPNKELKYFKLLSIAGAYWRGNEKNPMLTRIYGTAFPSQEELDAYLVQQEEARKRDHRKLGKELDLFVFSDLVGPGLPLYTPKGALIRRLLQQFVNELQGNIGYEEAWTPQLTKAELFKVSGHYDKYKDDMFRVSSNYSDEEFFLKPMNCPMHTQIYASRSRSYRDLPIRISDFANLYRDEKPGELSGLTRLRAFSQDDGHCFCREDQIEEEFQNVTGIITKAIATFGMKYWIRLSLWDPANKEKYLGSPEVWERAQEKLEGIVSKLGVEYKKAEGEAAIYGPKMDFMAVDALGREWQISTIQLDFIQPERFDLKYADQDGQLKTPVMIHRAILGSPERFLGLLIEHFAGAFPLWLAPVQVVIVPISEDQDNYAKKVVAALKAGGIRAENWNEAESMQNRIRKAEAQKVPYMLVVGKKEVANGSVAVRRRGMKNDGEWTIENFVEKVKKEIETKARW